MCDEKARVLFLVSETGGGHRASATALTAAFNALFPHSFEILELDPWSTCGIWPLNAIVPAYAFLSSNPAYWKVAYNMTRQRILRNSLLSAGNVLASKGMLRALTEKKPDIIVSVHPMCQHLPITVLKQSGHKILHFFTVVTDLGEAHPLWFHPKVSMTFVPTRAIKKLALKNSIALSKSRVYGLPLRPQFWSPESRRRCEVRKALNLDPCIPVVVLMGGGGGVGGMGELCLEVGKELTSAGCNLKIQIVAITGKNEQLRLDLKESLEDFVQTFNEPRPVAVATNGNGTPETESARVTFVLIGFSNDIEDWYAAADFLITKAGPGTIAEACACRLPIILSGFLPGQEEGNVTHVLDTQIGVYAPTTKHVAKVVRRWLDNPSLLRQFSRRMGNCLQNSRAALDIVWDIAQMVGVVPPVDGDPRPYHRMSFQDLERVDGNWESVLLG
eukprot:GHVO01068336.1.p1 GENE.GHVO01068336.1~~GHVO01068336.1.p1  ORF type:complete len:445 (-),score=33.89 GHVO01068336.1:154-1488(-)